MASLRVAWDTHQIDTNNPSLKFALAWNNLRRTLKDIQAVVKREEPSADSLQERLIQLEIQILNESDQSILDKFQAIRL